MNLSRVLLGVFAALGASACERERLNIGEYRDAGGADAAGARDAADVTDAAVADAPEPTIAVSCTALDEGRLPRNREAVLHRPDDRLVVSSPVRYLGTSQEIAGGSLLINGSDLLLAHADNRCQQGWWGVKLWTIPLDPDDGRGVQSACVAGTYRALRPRVVFTGNGLAMCFEEHRIQNPQTLVFEDPLFQCGSLDGAVFHRSQWGDPFDQLAMAAVQHGAEIVWTMAVASDKRMLHRSAIYRFDDRMSLVGPPTPLDLGNQLSPRRLVGVGGEAWLLSVSEDDLPAPRPVQWVRLSLGGEELGRTTLPLRMPDPGYPDVMDARAGLGGMVFLVRELATTAAVSGDLSIGLACPSGAVGYWRLTDDGSYDVARLVRDRDAWGVVAEGDANAPAGVEQRVVALRLGSDMAVLGEAHTVVHSEGVQLLDVTEGARSGDFWTAFARSATRTQPPELAVVQTTLRE